MHDEASAIGEPGNLTADGEPPRGRRPAMFVTVAAATVAICVAVALVLASREPGQEVGAGSTPPVQPLGDGAGRLVVTNVIGDRAYADMGPLPPDGLVALTQVLHGTN